MLLTLIVSERQRCGLDDHKIMLAFNMVSNITIELFGK